MKSLVIHQCKNINWWNRLAEELRNSKGVYKSIHDVEWTVYDYDKNN